MNWLDNPLIDREYWTVAWMSILKTGINTWATTWQTLGRVTRTVSNLMLYPRCKIRLASAVILNTRMCISQFLTDYLIHGPTPWTASTFSQSTAPSTRHPQPYFGPKRVSQYALPWPFLHKLTFMLPKSSFVTARSQISRTCDAILNRVVFMYSTCIRFTVVRPVAFHRGRYRCSDASTIVIQDSVQCNVLPLAFLAFVREIEVDGAPYTNFKTEWNKYRSSNKTVSYWKLFQNHPSLTTFFNSREFARASYF